MLLTSKITTVMHVNNSCYLLENKRYVTFIVVAITSRTKYSACP
ncbi:hypothetical protein ABIA18_000883 [Sinorhizobium fredii]